jgi:molecular chaperone GrpE (heat shock protein)
MHNNNLDLICQLIDNINEHICHTQKLNVELQEELQNTKHKVENTLDRATFRIINTLDFIYSIKKTLEIESLQIIIDKILKKLILFLEEIGVKEIVLEDNCTVDSKLTRVVDTKDAGYNQKPGSIIEICRRGYIRSGKVIRPVDVVTLK